MGGFATTFETCYQREFGFILPDRDVLVDDIRVRATGKNSLLARAQLIASADAPIPISTAEMWFEQGKCTCPLFRVDDLRMGQTVEGPAVLIEANSTIVVEQDCVASVDACGDLTIILGDGTPKRMTVELNAIHLSIFGHRFMSIAEQMGRALQRTSISVNIKERLDFSCALFSPEGGLVANAPHIPVHLGAMQEAVRYQLEILGDQIAPNDVLVSNHPAAGK